MLQKKLNLSILSATLVMGCMELIAGVIVAQPRIILAEVQNSTLSNYCPLNSGFGYFTFISQTTYPLAQDVNFCLQNNTRTPTFGNVSLWHIRNLAGNVVYTAPAVGFSSSTISNPYFDIWNQKDAAGNQVQPGNYNLIYTAAVNQPATAFSISTSSDPIGTRSSSTNNVNAQNIVVSPYIILNNYTGRQGDSIQVAGYMFTPDETIQVKFDGIENSQVTTTANASGNFLATLIVGKSMISDTYEISATGNMSGTTITAPFYVKGYYPAVHPSSYYVLPGNSLSFSGTDFAPNESITLYNGTSMIGNYSADSSGNISLNNVLLISHGQGNSVQTLKIVGGLSGYSMNFPITIGNFYPNINPSSYYLHHGQSFVVQGTNFAPNEPVNLSFNNQNYQVTADGLGNVSLNLVAPLNGGSYPINAGGVWSNTSSSRTITVAQ